MPGRREASLRETEKLGGEEGMGRKYRHEIEALARRTEKVSKNLSSSGELELGSRTSAEH